MKMVAGRLVLALAMSASLALAACNDSNPFYTSNKFQDAAYVKANVIPHKSTKADIERALGKPSSTSQSSGGRESWEYDSNGFGGVSFDSIRAFSSVVGADTVSSAANDAVGYQGSANVVNNTVNSGQVKHLNIDFEGDIVDSYSFYN